MKFQNDIDVRANQDVKTNSVKDVNDNLRSGIHNLLVVDDDIHIHNIISAAFLDNKQIQLIHAYNGKEGLQAHQELNPSLMLLDMNMPVMNGLQVLSHLDSQQDNKCPVIVFSGLASHKEQEKCIELGAQMFIEKPFHIMELINSINKILLPGSP